MEDIHHHFSDDLQISGTGDLATVSGSDMTQLRVIRMICTPEDDYIFEPGWGLGAGAYVGAPSHKLQILKQKIISRIVAVGYAAESPAPEVDVRTDGTLVYLDLRYVDAETQETQQLSFTA